MNTKLKAILDNDALWNFVHFISFLILIGLVYISEMDAAAYCEGYCKEKAKAMYGDDNTTITTITYTPGNCKCKISKDFSKVSENYGLPK